MSIQKYGLQDLIQLMLTAYAAKAKQEADVGTGSQFGPMYRAMALAEQLLQNENVYVETILRLAAIQDPLPDGTPNPDVDSFVNPFNFFRNGPGYAVGGVTVSIPASLPTDKTIPVGYLFGANAGPTYTVAANGPGYNSGAGGYVIPAGQTSVIAYVQCNVSGSQGNALPNTITQVLSGPNGSPPDPTLAISNALLLTGGVDSEVGQPLKTRFAQYIAGGGEGTPTSIMAAVGQSMTGITYSYGDFVMGTEVSNVWTFTPNTDGWFTVCVDIMGAPGTITQDQLNTIAALILNDYRAGGIHYAVAPPTPLDVAGAGTVVLVPGADPGIVVPAVNAAFITFVNNLGLDPLGGPMICSIMAAYIALSQVPGVLRIDNLTLNSGNADITADFGQILRAGTPGFAA